MMLTQLALLIPVLLIIAGGTTALALAIGNLNLISSECRKAIWVAQESMGKQLKQLLKLNSRAQTLRIKRKVAEAELKAAQISLDPPAILAAQVRLTAVQIQQKQLRHLQLSWLLQATQSRSQAFSQVQKLKSKIEMESLHHHSKVNSLAVVESPPESPSPDYLLQPNFKQQQKLTLRYKVNLFTKYDSILKFILPEQKLFFTGQCTASLFEENKKWYPQLIAAKF